MIGKILIPGVSVDYVCSSIQLLHELKMIEIDSDGFCRPVTDVISIGYDATGCAL